jgi:hypothetical protein
MGRYAPFTEPARFSRVVGAAHLLAARLQPSYCNWPQAWVDFVFQRDDEIVLVPFVQIEPAMISVREMSPLLWPSWLPLDDPTVEALEERVEPWLLSHALLEGISEERIGFFTEDTRARATFEAAREARFLCAAPIEPVLIDAAPCIYAQRFAAGRRIGIASSDAALGASLLTGTAASVHADLGDAQRNECARGWYGLGIYGELPRATFDVSIGPSANADASVAISLDGAQPDAAVVKVARPVFASVACSFDLQDGPEARRFSVRARQPILRPNRLTAAPVIGGSAGRILIVIRDNGLTLPDADVDQARALVDALSVQGFDARLSVATAARAADVDLIHLIGHRHAHQFGYVLDDAERLGVPVVTTPILDDFASEALWGTTAIRTMLTGVLDDMAQESIESGMVTRRLLVGGSNERGNPAYSRDALRRIFAQSRAVIFASEQEEAYARTEFALTIPSRVVPCVPRKPVEAAAAGELCGIDEYVLIHGPIEPRGNQHLAVRAAAAAAVPCVVVGSVADVDYYYSMLGVCGSQFICLPENEISEERLEGLYAGARVFADLSWAGHGLTRLVRAAAHGTLPVLSSALPYGELWPDLTGSVDPASLESAKRELRQAWMRAPALSHQIAERTAQRADPLGTLQAVLGAYAEAAGLKSTAR